MNINDVTVSWQDISDTERTALLNKPCPPRSKAKAPPPRQTPDRVNSRVFSICQSAVMNNHTVQRPVRLNNLKSHATMASSKENIDNAYRTMIEFTETCKRESNNDTNPTEMPTPKRIRSSSPASNLEQCSSPSAIARYISHDSYLSFNPPPPLPITTTTSSSSEQQITTNEQSNIETDFIDDTLWDDWDLPSTVNKKTPGKIRTMSSPAVHSRINPFAEIKRTPRTTTTTNNNIELTKVEQTSTTESITLAPVISTIVWDDDDDFEQLLSQLPTELTDNKPIIDNDSVLITTPPIDDNNCTRLDATRRSSAFLTKENQSLIHNSTNIELSSQRNRSSISSLQRASTGPLSSPVINRNSTKINSPRVRCDSASVEQKKSLCTEAEIERKRLAAVALRRKREQERQQQQQQQQKKSFHK